MKKNKIILTILVLSVSFLCCDPSRYYDYFVTNKCNETIKVKISYTWKVPYGKIESLNLLIKPNTTYLIISFEDYQPLEDFMVEVYFKEILVTKENDTSKVNYVDKNIWRFEPTSKIHSNSYLTIYPKDFENE